jgi:tetratricopeptide (TPR) repeat protein
MDPLTRDQPAEDAAGPRGVDPLDHAIDLHLAGRFAEAEAIYRRAVSDDQADAQHLLGLVLHQTGRSSEAEQHVRRAIAIDPGQAPFHTHLGLILTALGGVDDGIACHRRATELDPGSADAQNNLGVALAAAGRPGEAVDSYRRALAIQPDAKVWENLARALVATGRVDDAVAAYRQAIEADPTSAQLHADLGHVLRNAGAIEAAIAEQRRAVELMPTSPVPLDNLGSALQKAGRADEAMATFALALALEPGRPESWNHIGTVHCEAGRWYEAEAAFEQALAARPEFGDAVNNIGTVYEEQGRRAEAMACYQRALRLSPRAVSPPWNVALMQLLTGDYAAGWVGYEHRWRQPLQSKVLRNFPQPMWDGSPLDGRRLLLHAEQGLGDAIHFARYAPLAARMGGRVFVECHPPLVKLFRSLGGVDRVVPREQGPALPFDVHCPFMSLPRVFGTTLENVPAEVPYLRPPPAEVNRWRRRLATEPRARRVGLVWAGDPKHQKDRDRSLHLSALAPLAGVPGVRFYSLQLGPAAAQLATPPAGLSVVDWTADFADFTATAGLVSQLDLVITIDSSVAHLSAALGRPTWVLLAFAPDWRWLLDREDSPWYPTVRLFRQDAARNWTRPIEAVTESLRVWASGVPASAGYGRPASR